VSWEKIERLARGGDVHGVSQHVRVGIRKNGKAGLEFFVKIPPSVAGLMSVGLGSKASLFVGHLADEGTMRVVPDDEGLTLRKAGPHSSAIELCIRTSKVFPDHGIVRATKVPRHTVTDDGELVFSLPSVLLKSEPTPATRPPIANNPLRRAIERRAS